MSVSRQPAMATPTSAATPREQQREEQQPPDTAACPATTAAAKTPAACCALDVPTRKKRDREAILARYQSWRPDGGAAPAPADDRAGAFRDVSRHALSHLSDAERAIVQTDATGLVARLASGELSAVAVLTAFAKAAVAAQDLTNCLTEIFIEEGLARARELDDHYRRTGTVVGPLHGLPVSVKDHILLKGYDTSTGYIAWAYNTVADKDAIVVDILRQAGAVFYVKTANPQTLLSLETNNNIYGTTYNPFNRDLAPGGSSGGESALIASFGSPLGIGTDIGGSIRVPAAWCGLYGLKGSVGRLPHAGLLGSHDGMDNIVGCVGPLARSARDLELFCRVMSDARAWLLEHQVLAIPWRPVAEVEVPKKLCIAVLWDDGVVAPHPPITRALCAVKDALEAAGHEVIEWEPLDHWAHWELIRKLYLLDGGAEYYQTLRDGGEDPVPQTAWLLGQSEGAFAVSETWRLNVAREQFRTRVLAHWNATAARTRCGRAVDAVLCPVAPTLAPPHESVRWWGYSSYWNLCDYPGVVFPMDRLDPARLENLPPVTSQARNEIEAFVQRQWDPTTYANAPVGLQLVGRRLGEERLLRVLQVLEGALGRV